MRYTTAIIVVIASILAFTSIPTYAQGHGRGGGASADRTHQVDRDRTYDRDRITDRDRTQDRGRINVPEQDRDRDRDRDRIHDPANMSDQDIYGHQFMTNEERHQYREELGNATTPKSRGKVQERHEKRMQERALAQGQDLVPPGQGPIYGGEFMSVQERNQYREQLRLLDSDPERERFQMQHRERIKQRADALGLEVADAD